jgi:hypothetical protein
MTWGIVTMFSRPHTTVYLPVGSLEVHGAPKQPQSIALAKSSIHAVCGAPTTLALWCVLSSLLCHIYICEQQERQWSKHSL